MTAQVRYLSMTGLHEAVIRAAGGRCECTGRCGAPHLKGRGRCLIEHQARRPLHAVPRDPAVSAVDAARLTASDLMALCLHCYDGAASRDAREAHSAAEPQEALFGGDAG